MVLRLFVGECAVDGLTPCYLTLASVTVDLWGLGNASLASKDACAQREEIRNDSFRRSRGVVVIYFDAGTLEPELEDDAGI